MSETGRSVLDQVMDMVNDPVGNLEARLRVLRTFASLYEDFKIGRDRHSRLMAKRDMFDIPADATYWEQKEKDVYCKFTIEEIEDMQAILQEAIALGDESFLGSVMTDIETEIENR